MEQCENEIKSTNVKNETTEKDSSDYKMNANGIDIVRAIVDETIVSKIIQKDAENSKIVVKNIIEEVLVTEIINCNSNTNVSETNSTQHDSKSIDKNFSASTSDSYITADHKSSSEKENETSALDSVPKDKSQKGTNVDIASEEDKDTNSSDENSEDETGMNLKI